MWFALSLLAAPSALAQEPERVLVSALQPRNAEAATLAALIEGFLAEKLAAQAGVAVVRVEDTPDFEDYSARIYMESCPPGEIEGCTFVVAERGRAAWAVTGTVRSLVEGTRVQIDIVDVAGARVAVSFQADLDSGDDEAFAEGVARVLAAAIAGEMGREHDIRDLDGDGDAEVDPLDKDAVAAELASLAREMGDVTTIARRTGSLIERPAYTVADLAERMQTEGAKPWERLGMTPGEYLRYKNSGVPLVEWRARASGRAGQVVVRAGGGGYSGPVNGRYYGRYAYDDATLQTVDAYAQQSIETGSGGLGVLGIAYGVHPAVDVGVLAGLAGGSFTYFVDKEPVSGATVASQPVTVQNRSWFVGPRVTVALLPASPWRPSFGVGAYWFRGTGIGDHIDISSTGLATWEAQDVWLAEAFVGGELRVSREIDLFLQLPLHVRIAGDAVVEKRTTETAALDGLESSAGASAVGGGVVAGIQVRLGGRPDTGPGPIEEDWE